jgi:hypothetical protein
MVRISGISKFVNRTEPRSRSDLTAARPSVDYFFFAASSASIRAM